MLRRIKVVREKHSLGATHLHTILLAYKVFKEIPDISY